MKRREKIAMQDEHIDILIKNLPVLRVATQMTQAQLADRVGVSRQTIVAIETRKRPMPWTLYLAIMFVFMRCKGSKTLLEKLDLFDDEFITMGL